VQIGQPAQTVQDAKIKGISTWFYIIAVLQLVAAYLTWSNGAIDAGVAQAAMVLAAADVVIGALFVVLGYFAGKRHSWAFVAGLVLYGIRALLQFNILALVLRLFLMFRIWQGLQACLAANRADRVTKLMNQRRFVMPQASVDTVEPAAPPQAWVPSRAPAE
jgi:hypothetical protein